VRVGGFTVVIDVGWGVRGLAGAAVLVLAAGPAAADTLKWALTQAYLNNPQLNSQRASVRATARRRSSPAAAMSAYLNKDVCAMRGTPAVPGSDSFLTSISRRA